MLAKDDAMTGKFGSWAALEPQAEGGGMECAECEGVVMQRRATRDGVELEACPRCNSLWFDRGEIYFFVRNHGRITQAIADARRGAPDEPWLEGALADNAPFLLEARTGGIFLPAAAVDALTRTGELAVAWHEPRRATPVVFGAPHLAAPTVLALVSFTVLFVVISLVVVHRAATGTWLTTPLALTLLVLPFLVGPFVLDVSVRWLHGARPRKLEALPRHLGDFLTRTCSVHGMRRPQILVIPDGTPEAFTYGHTPSNARIVISDGLIAQLDPLELEAVVGHELGHARHWDLLLMTAAQAVPELLAMFRRSLERKSDGNQSARWLDSMARVLLAVELASDYVVLWLSRTREYHADRFGAEAVGSATAMARALVKVAYGLAAKKREAGRPQRRAMGIFDRRAAGTLALITRGATGPSRFEIEEDALLGAMKWDLWNPWAWVTEIHSTHPLVAKRLLHLSAVSEHLGEPMWLRFDLARPESYWDEFAVDLLVVLLPLGMYAASWKLFDVYGFFGLGIGIVLIGISSALELRFRYPTRGFPEMSVGTLMRQVKVSGVRPIPCRIDGTIIGRGEAGFIWSEDFVLRDATGMLYVDHRQPLRLWEFLWGFFVGPMVLRGDAIVEGWYRRSPVPYIEVRRFWIDGKERRAWFSMCSWVVALGLVVGGSVLAWLHR